MTTSTIQDRPPIAIVGVSALFPGSVDATGFWRDILAGRDMLQDVPASHWLLEDYYDPDPSAPDKTYAKRGGFLPEVGFDALRWGVPPNIMPATDTSQLLALIVAEQVLRDAARGQFDTMDRSRISVILGVTSAQELLGTMVSRLQKPVWQKALRDHGLPENEVQAVCKRIADHYVPWQEASFPGLLGNVVAGRIANRLDLGGTNCVTDAACASTFSALSMAVRELYLGDSDLVITGGVDTLNDIFMYVCFSKTPALSATGDCRPFSDNADGTILGEGLGMVALKRLADAERDGDRIYGVVAGVGASSDGRSKSVYAPVPEGQARALSRAYEIAGFGPETVELIEAHGTGTKAGDVAEFKGLVLAFDAVARADRQWCALGTVKSQIGHTKAAAGAAGLFKTIMALHHKALPPTIKVDQPNPKLALEASPFYLNTKARPWIRSSEHPRRAGVSSFGFGGSNFHVALEEYTGKGARADRLRALSAELVVVTGVDGAAVARRAVQLAARSDAPGMLQRIAWETTHEYDYHASARLVVVASCEADLRKKLQQLATIIEKAPTAPFVRPDGSAFGLDAHQGGVAFLFPGQGSQYLQMGADVAMAFDAARAPWDRAASEKPDGVRRLDQVVFPIPRFGQEALTADADLLRATEWAQPAIGATSLSYLALLDALGVEAEAVAGHSFGEVTALHAAGVLTESELLRVARRRGELMAAAAERPGSMTAVSATIEQVRSLLAELDNADVVVANHNAPDQVVLSGTIEAIEAAEALAETKDLKVKRLQVATAFHSPVVSSSEAPFHAFLSEVSFSKARIKVWSGESAKPYEAKAASKRSRLARQIANPVQFVDVVQAMADAGIRTFVEVGPGASLTGLVDRILPDQRCTAIPLDRRGKDGIVSLLRGLGRMVAAGVPMNLSALWNGYGEPEDVAARETSKLVVPLCGANHGKLYPPKVAASIAPAQAPHLAAAPKTSAPAQRSAPANVPPASTAPAPRPPTPMAATPAPATLAAPTPAAPPMQATLPRAAAPVSDGWLAAWQEGQRQCAMAHTAFQQAMGQTHSAYLSAMETSFAGLASLAGGLPSTAGTQRPLQVVASPAPQMTAPPMPAPTAPPPVMAPSLVMHEPQAIEDGSAATSAGPPEAAAAAVSTPDVDLQSLMLAVVSDKTGYPAEMVELGMDLEGDLGIDSIKRVEILSAVQQRAPGMPEVDAAHMSTLKTLGQIVDYMQELVGQGSPGRAPAASTTAAAPALTVDLQALMLAVVSDKTGYPAEMVELGMDLEGDLGIDSIKRVEILSAVQQQAPGMPEVDAAHMSALKTLGQIVDYMQALVGAPQSTPLSSAGAQRAPVPEGPTATLSRYALSLVASPAVGLAQPNLLGASEVLITGDRLAGALATELMARGVKARAVDCVQPGAQSVVYLGGLRDVDSEEQAIAVQREAFGVARTIAPSLRAGPGLFVTVQDTGGAFGTSDMPRQRAYLAGLAALVKTASQEWPDASLKAVDLERGGRDDATLATALADELLLGGGDLEVGLSAAGARRVPRSEESVLSPSAPTATAPMGREDVIVVSGGARGVTAACVVALAKDSGAHFLLLGRTSMEDEPACCAGVEGDGDLKLALLSEAKANGGTLTPAELSNRVFQVTAGREVRATLAAVEAAGGRALYRCVNVTEMESVSAAIEGVRANWGRVTGIVHGAGVLADRLIEEQTDAQFSRVFDTKVEGLRVLLAATRSDPLRLICLFSSVSARCGNSGQCAYAMANEVLNKVAWAEARDRGEHVLVKSLGWGPWEGGMVNSQLRQRFAQLGVPMIPLAEGAKMLKDELHAGAPAEVELVLGAEPRPDVLHCVGANARKLTLEVQLSHRSHAYLAGHRIAGEVVVPVALVLEWFSRMARALRPDLQLESVNRLKVLKGIRLGGFEREGDRLILRCHALSNGEGAVLALELESPSGTPHYRAEARMVAERLSVSTDEAASLKLDDWGGAPVYGDVLFHSLDFQLIQGLEGVSDAGIAGTVNGVDKANWGWERWDTDVAALDGGLQLLLLWARSRMGGATLPMGIGEFRMGNGTPSEGAVRCTARCRTSGRDRGLADVMFEDEGGRRVAELKDVELILRPDSGQRRV